MSTRRLLTALLSLSLTGPAAAQDTPLTLLEGHQLGIEGTSNLRQWDADAKVIEAQFVLQDFPGDFSRLDPGMFKTLILRVPVDEISSGTRGLSGKIHKYLKKDEHPRITFTLDRVTAVTWDGPQAAIDAVGTLNAAGKDHAVALTVAAAVDTAGALVVSGTQALKMTAFGIKPPTALLGTIRADDDFAVPFRLRFGLGAPRSP